MSAQKPKVVRIDADRLISNENGKPEQRVIAVQDGEEEAFVHQISILDDNDICIANLVYRPLEEGGKKTVWLETSKRIVTV